MKLKMAIRLIEGIVREHVRVKYGFNANLFDRGIVVSERTLKDSNERRVIEDAWWTIMNSIDEERK